MTSRPDPFFGAGTYKPRKNSGLTMQDLWFTVWFSSQYTLVQFYLNLVFSCLRV